MRLSCTAELQACIRWRPSSSPATKILSYNHILKCLDLENPPKWRITDLIVADSAFLCAGNPLGCFLPPNPAPTPDRCLAQRKVSVLDENSVTVSAGVKYAKLCLYSGLLRAIKAYLHLWKSAVLLKSGLCCLCQHEDVTFRCGQPKNPSMTYWCLGSPRAGLALG